MTLAQSYCQAMFANRRCQSTDSIAVELDRFLLDRSDVHGGRQGKVAVQRKTTVIVAVQNYEAALIVVNPEASTVFVHLDAFTVHIWDGISLDRGNTAGNVVLGHTGAAGQILHDNCLPNEFRIEFQPFAGVLWATKKPPFR